MVQHALTLSPVNTVGVDALRWIARRHRIITIMPGVAAGMTGPWMHVLALPESHEALGLQPGTVATLSADDVFQSGRSSMLQKLIERHASVTSDRTPWVTGIRHLCLSEYSPIATVSADSVDSVNLADWAPAMHLSTDRKRRLIKLRSKYGQWYRKIQADHVARSIDYTVDARRLLIAIMDCHADIVTIASDRRPILRISPAGSAAGARAVYLRAVAGTAAVYFRATAPAAIAT